VVALKQNSGPAAARNAGVAASSAPLEFSVLFCSFSRGIALEGTCSRHKNLVHHWTHQTASAEAITFCGGFGLIRRRVFVAVGGFNSQQRFLEDVDLGYRLHRAGHRILLAKNIQAMHAKAYTLGSLLRSDLFGHAVPWTRLMLKYGIFRNDLNTRVHNVLSVQAACLMPLSAVLDPHLRLTTALVLVFLWLNRSFLRLGAQEYGLAFAMRSACLCWLSYVASAAGVCMGAGAWLWGLCSSGGRLLAESRGS
jgi:GT2 family glycosyltransferase